MFMMWCLDPDQFQGVSLNRLQATLALLPLSWSSSGTLKPDFVKLIESGNTSGEAAAIQRYNTRLYSSIAQLVERRTVNP